MQTEMNTKAVEYIPNKPSWKVWWKLTRPHTLTAGFVPVLIGTALAINNYEINIMLFCAMMLASLLIQAATNMFNEYYDFKRGLDHEGSVGIGGAIVRDGITPRTVMTIALSLYGISALIGVYICMSTTWWLAVVGLIAMTIGYLYTGGPIPIAYTPFGEIFAGLFMGMLIILISFYIQANEITTLSILVSIPIAVTVGAILLSNNIRDLDGDKENGRKTLAILLAKKKAVIFLASMFAFAYLWIIALVLMNVITPWTLLVILSLPLPIKSVKGFLTNDTPIKMAPAMVQTAKTNTIFGFLLAIGLFIGHFI
nr:MULTISPECIES: 1,4-dihydroxy-2-naphthoate polyprenyltransferase [Bacillus]